MKQSAWKTTPPQYNPRAAGLLRHDPRPKGAGKIQQKLNKVRFESRPRKRQRPMPKEDDDPIIVAYSNEEKDDDPIIIVAGLEGDEQKGPGGRTYQKRRIPLSCPWKKRKEVCPMLTPQDHCPTLPPEDEDWGH